MSSDQGSENGTAPLDGDPSDRPVLSLLTVMTNGVFLGVLVGFVHLSWLVLPGADRPQWEGSLVGPVALLVVYHCVICCALLLIGRCALAMLTPPITARRWHVWVLRPLAAGLVSLAAVSAFLGTPDNWAWGAAGNIGWTCTALVLILGLAAPAGVAIAWCLARPWATGSVAQATCAAIAGALLCVVVAGRPALGTPGDVDGGRVVVSASASRAPLAPIRPPGLRGVVMIVIDALRTDHVHCLDGRHSLTPSIDRLADSGVRFSQAISQGAWTPPSMAAFMTGRYPSVHRGSAPTDTASDTTVLDGVLALAEGIPTLAEVLGGAGWSCAAFVENLIMCPEAGFHRGFDHFRYRETPCHESDPWRSSRLGGWRSKLLAWAGYRSRSPINPITECADDVGAVDSTIEWLTTHTSRPFFCWVHLMAVHDYLCQELPSNSLDGAVLSRPGDHAAREVSEAMAVGSDEGGAVETDLPTEDELARYPISVRYDDLLVGKVMAALRDLDVLRDTLVIVLSDHGEELGDHGGKGHGHTLYDELIRVPLVMACPGRIRPGGAVDVQVRAIDLFPTILELAGVKSPEPIDGRSLVPLIDGQDGQHRTAFTRCVTGVTPIESVRMPPRKLIVATQTGNAQLYDLIADPHERRNIAESNSEAAGKLASQLGAWRDTIRTARGRTRPGRLADPEEMRRKLKALGYLE